ncbi:TIGR04282 family arsenosugar biosynthesis glycosyltransferase [Pontibacter diazotrophicus]|uniref:TIGR04282 family arsenosugar biosynthesis glycosyltransferase n=1 Tax=Pontibacter diazotrophicus TaxID=1400979 RepID=UPI0015F1875F|nr:DUF2064 domain-containing protein [Pontibacter diazotrophicus]
MSTPSDTAILLFAHAAEHEVKSKTFSSWHSVHVNQKIAKVLLKHTLRTIKKSGIPCLTVYTEQQKGRTFGERLANAFQDAFQAGYQRVICVGSDCPTLSPADLQQAKAALQGHRMVVGPASDGGAYLIGLHIDNFNPEAFAMLNWQTEQVMQELSIYVFRQEARLDAFELLQEKADIDTKEDLSLILQQLPVLNRLKRQILFILTKKAAKEHVLRGLLQHRLGKHLHNLLLRAPPFQPL